MTYERLNILTSVELELCKTSACYGNIAKREREREGGRHWHRDSLTLVLQFESSIFLPFPCYCLTLSLSSFLLLNLYFYRKRKEREGWTVRLSMSILTVLFPVTVPFSEQYTEWPIVSPHFETLNLLLLLPSGKERDITNLCLFIWTRYRTNKREKAPFFFSLTLSILFAISLSLSPTQCAFSL